MAKIFRITKYFILAVFDILIVAAGFKKIVQLLVAKWGDELVVFNPNSGDTHLLPVMLEPIINYCLERDDLLFSELLSGFDIFTNGFYSLSESQSVLEEGVNQLVDIGFLQPVTRD